MKPLLYLHIGFPKTGSSSIQSFLNANRELLKKEGICYPMPLIGSSRLEDHEGHSAMSPIDAFEQFDPISWEEYRKEYLHNLLTSKCPKNILSSEAFVYDDPTLFGPFFNDFNIYIICYFRNVFDLLSSSKKQVVKEGLRVDLTTFLLNRNIHVLACMEDYISLMGPEKCIFKNYDKLRVDGNLLHDLAETVDIKYENLSFPLDQNVSPSDAITMFLYQLSYLPLTRDEFNTVCNSILQQDQTKWREYRCTLLPLQSFHLDAEAKSAIRRQGELLQDPDWYDKTIARGKELADIPNHDLPPEIQYDIFENLSDNAREILVRYWPQTGKASPTTPFLPSMENLTPESTALLDGLYYSHAISQGNTSRQLRELSATQASSYKKKPMLHFKVITGFSVAWAQVKASCQMFFSSKTRQAYAVRDSGLFDITWYYEQYPDVAKAGIDPIRHYIYYGAAEGRDPAPWFSTNAYLNNNPDVASVEINPFFHYICYGVNENRQL